MMTGLRKSVSGRLYLAVLGLALTLTADQAMAQVRAAYTKNVDEPGRRPYQLAASFIPSSCSTNGILYFCALDLPAVPTGKRLVVEHISMFVAVSGGTPDLLRFRNQNFNTLFWVQPTFTPRVNFPGQFFLDRPVDVYYEPDDTPNVGLQLTAPLSVAEITVHGYLIDAVN